MAIQNCNSLVMEKLLIITWLTDNQRITEDEFRKRSGDSIIERN